ncbi:hypothetical protein ACQEVZ_59460 [Dactylosporangium sp. CA-152071]|uniref:hypothetical protein n=1 Tax=Dactylosporangium sp. CA-152071 TaxID=3239933 RepID=UPI003D94833D
MAPLQQAFEQRPGAEREQGGRGDEEDEGLGELWATKLNGRRLQVATSPSSAVPARTGTAAMSSFVEHQRIRPTDWVSAKMWVPCSNSRAKSGAPANMPSRTGRHSSTSGRTAT